MIKTALRRFSQKSSNTSVFFFQAFMWLDNEVRCVGNAEKNVGSGLGYMKVSKLFTKSAFNVTFPSVL